MPDLDPQEYEALERAELLGNGGAIWRAARNYYRAALAAREEPQTDGVAAWADHANRIADAERVIDGAAYVPAIEAYCVVRDLQAMQGDGVLYSPQERDGVFRWAAAREDTERPEGHRRWTLKQTLHGKHLLFEIEAERDPEALAEADGLLLPEGLSE